MFLLRRRDGECPPPPLLLLFSLSSLASIGVPLRSMRRGAADVACMLQAWGGRDETHDESESGSSVVYWEYRVFFLFIEPRSSFLRKQKTLQSARFSGKVHNFTGKKLHFISSFARLDFLAFCIFAPSVRPYYGGPSPQLSLPSFPPEKTTTQKELRSKKRRDCSPPSVRTLQQLFFLSPYASHVFGRRG